ncbi:hypothetical protein [Planctobacterium marinum]|uniref:hypothetical protein n=1 Tax=Planctobacterium marinum TaxID=1631968 RepID=UPI001E51ACD8|nr:hypothetical protein [Planctobacterium marinum]MCC2605104.1 hypothetical protein [Planctobacterium marinum]
MTQPKTTDSQSHYAAQPASQEQQHESQEQLLSQSEQLLQNALNSCNIPGFTPVQLAFPNAISGHQQAQSSNYSMNIQQLFAQQAQLFNPPQENTDNPGAPVTDPVPDPNAVTDHSPAETTETDELQAIRAMFDSN